MYGEKHYSYNCVSVFLISSYGAPLAKRASYLALHSSLFGPDGTVNYAYIVTKKAITGMPHSYKKNRKNMKEIIIISSTGIIVGSYEMTVRGERRGGVAKGL